MTAIVPTLKHRRVARRLLEESKKRGAERVYDLASRWQPRDAALVIVALTSLMEQPAPRPAHRPRADDATFTRADEIRALHAAYVRGDRSFQVVAGERQYQRDRSKRRRAAARQARQEASNG